MIVKLKYIVSYIIITILFLGCGVKKYEEILTCDELETLVADELSEDKISDLQQSALTAYNSLKGSWHTTFDCMNEQPSSMDIKIEQIEDSNVEFFIMQDDAECDDIGTAVFEATISNSGDADLDGKRFFMTTLLSPADKSVCNSFNPYILDASSKNQTSVVSGFLSFSLKIKVDCDMQISASKYATTNTVSGQSGATSITQGDFCTMDDWKPVNTD